METHVFNEKKKRLEPIEDICVFCGKNKSENQEDNFYLPLFKEVDRTNVVVYRKVSFQRIDVGLPRCPHCKNEHEKQQKMVWLYTVLGGLVSCVASYYIFRSTFEEMTIFMVILMGMLGSLITFFISRIVVEKVSLKRKGILTKKEAALHYDIVRRLLHEGWSFNQPQA